MNSLHRFHHSLIAGALSIPGTLCAQLTFLSGTQLPNSGGEIVSYYEPTSSVLSTFSDATAQGVRIHTIAPDGSLSLSQTVNLTATFNPQAQTVFSLTSVKADPLGRDFGVATLVPSDRGNTVGKAVFFQLSTGTVLNSVDVGYHPDSVTMTPDGTRVVVANEGEFISTVATQREGSISVIGLPGVINPATLQGAALTATTADFSAANLGPGVTLNNLRNNRVSNSPTPGAALPVDIEPEFAATSNTKAYVTLQENNAVGVFDFASGKWEKIHNLGVIQQTVDVSDRDGAALALPSANDRPAINISSVRTGAPMPDAIALYSQGGNVYFGTANEGDARPDDGDQVRSGRLNVTSTGFGAFTKEGTYTEGVMFGTRSVSLWNAETGDLLGDTGSTLETQISTLDKPTFGMNGNARFGFSGTPLNNYTSGYYTSLNAGGAVTGSNSDTRSDDKGPEGESIAFGPIEGREFMFTAMERQGGIFMFDVTDPTNPLFTSYLNLTQPADALGQSFLSPESLTFIPRSDSPTGQYLLLVGFENPVNPFGAFAVLSVPEASDLALPFVSLILGGIIGRRFRRRTL